MHNIDYSIAHARARGTYSYEIKFLQLKENLYYSQKKLYFKNYPVHGSFILFSLILLHFSIQLTPT